MTRSEFRPRRFAGLPLRRHGDRLLPVANRPLTRLLGLSLLDLDQAGPGLILPRCRSVHSFGMRFPLTIFFLDRHGQELGDPVLLPPRRICGHPEAHSVVELTPEAA
jgi:hypothetical protein